MDPVQPHADTLKDPQKLLIGGGILVSLVLFMYLAITQSSCSQFLWCLVYCSGLRYFMRVSVSLPPLDG